MPHSTDLYEIVGGNPVDALCAVSALLNVVNVQDPDQDGLYYVHAISCSLIQQVVHELADNKAIREQVLTKGRR